MDEPLATIVICSYNGAARITDAISSLKNQDRSAGSFDILVVDDGSTDSTSAIVASLGVRLIRHDRNRGIAVARNTGLAHSTTAFVGYIDDDIVADAGWLTNLFAAFTDGSVVGASGSVHARQTRRLAQRYLLAAGYGNPSPLKPTSANSAAARLSSYLRSMFSPVSRATTTVEVESIYTANVMYRRRRLTDIGGFDESLVASEDTDVSTRLRRAGGRLVFVPGACVRHRHHETMVSFLAQTYRRGGGTLGAYLQAGLMPPIFPSPLIWIGLDIAFAMTVGMVPAIVACAAIPLALYPWWLVSAAKGAGRERLLYPYVQLAVETMANLGLGSALLHRAAGARERSRG